MLFRLTMRTLLPSGEVVGRAVGEILHRFNPVFAKGNKHRRCYALNLRRVRPPRQAPGAFQ